jgi:hypothetical protein
MAVEVRRTKAKADTAFYIDGTLTGGPNMRKGYGIGTAE